MSLISETGTAGRIILKMGSQNVDWDRLGQDMTERRSFVDI
jgi:hypothetical protein